MAMGLMLFFNFILIFIAFWVHGCAGFSINSLKSAVSLLRFEHGLGRHNLRQFDTAMAPSLSNFRHPWKKHVHDDSSSISPSGSVHKKHHKRNFAPQPSYLLPQSHGYSPSLSPYRSPAPAPSSSRIKIPMAAPTMSPLRSLDKKKKTTATTTLPSSPFMLLPPPPPNEDCTSLICSAPLTNTPSGSPCGCVWPIEVRLRLNIELYTFFPLVSELAKEIALGFSLNESQVRIMGANAATQQLDRTVVLINLVPLQGNFNSKMTYFVYEKFWKKQLPIRGSLFGAYDVVDVRYPGLPPSPPLVPTAMDEQPFPNHGNDGMAIKPIGVDISRRAEKSHIQGSIVTVIVLSSATAFMVFLGLAWLLIWKFNCRISHTDHPPESLPSSHQKTTPGNTNNVTTITGMSSASMSFDSNLLAYTGTAKIFSLNEIEKATDNFEDSRILGEGGFGLVYRGVLDDGRRVAVKVLKRDDKQGSREFLAEVEMLSRLHHRNLVKLIGICSEDHHRCLIYELVPNGSVESHLHGIDKETAPLDWSARMKIALGAARGLAYLHEDSSPRVIHRDFKSSNILLEHDFTPKVSDFGLARAAIDEGNKHISTHVMGTFGYLAPEYAMTGHLLVKSDVYSYGVVLLELLTGRKPVDLSQPPGQENLVAWARPLLGSKEGLEMIVDPALKSNIPFDSAAKVAAIASMCVQPEVSHRPFMGEVVQALKLVCDEFDETKELISRSCSLEEEISAGFEGREFDSIFETRIPLSDLKEVSTSLGGDQEFESFRRESNSAPLKMERRRGLWQRLRGLSRGSMSEQGFSSKL